MKKKTDNYVTQKELIQHKKEVERLIKDAKKEIKSWDKKQDKAFVKKSSK